MPRMAPTESSSSATRSGSMYWYSSGMSSTWMACVQECGRIPPAGGTCAFLPSRRWSGPTASPVRTPGAVRWGWCPQTARTAGDGCARLFRRWGCATGCGCRRTVPEAAPGVAVQVGQGGFLTAGMAVVRQRWRARGGLRHVRVSRPRGTEVSNSCRAGGQGACIKFRCGVIGGL